MKAVVAIVQTRPVERQVAELGVLIDVIVDDFLLQQVFRSPIRGSGLCPSCALRSDRAHGRSLIGPCDFELVWHGRPLAFCGRHLHQLEHPILTTR